MRLDLSLDHSLNLLSGLLLLGIAGVVLWVRPSRKPQRLFGWFVALFGLRFIAINLNQMIKEAPRVDATFGLVGGAAFFCATYFVVRFSLTYPGPSARPRLMVLPACLAGVFFVLWLHDGIMPFWRDATAADLANAVSYTLMVSALWGVVLLYALRYRGASRDDGRRLALMAAALVIWPAFQNGFYGPGGTVRVVYWVGIAVIALLSAVWLSMARGHGRAQARNVALVAAGGGAAGALFYLISYEANAFAQSGVGLSRIVGAAILAYAIVRHQLLGIDVKLKWTIKQSTIAAVFIGLFFVVSESAATYFSQRVGTYLGIVAAGALVFLMTPLQRFAQRVADKAMPDAKPLAALSEAERASLYRQQAVEAWHDGAINRSERAMLDRLREGLGLSAEIAARIESDAAR